MQGPRDGHVVVNLQPQQPALQAPAPFALTSPIDHPRIILTIPTLDLDFCKHALYTMDVCWGKFSDSTLVGSNVFDIVNKDMDFCSCCYGIEEVTSGLSHIDDILIMCSGEL